MLKWTPALLLFVGCVAGDNIIPADEPLVPIDELETVCRTRLTVINVPGGQILELRAKGAFTVNGQIDTLVPSPLDTKSPDFERLKSRFEIDTGEHNIVIGVALDDGTYEVDTQCEAGGSARLAFEVRQANHRFDVE